ncbi:hypothetical protein TNCV_745261 [Trichonephila clavipes]|nr:hypothetical protein TNCV_745261 [Trichonephila clavipes]
MEEMVEELQEQINQLRQDAKRNIQKIQAENKRTYDRKRKKAPRYQKGDLVAIQRTQFGSEQIIRRYVKSLGSVIPGWPNLWESCILYDFE